MRRPRYPHLATLLALALAGGRVRAQTGTPLAPPAPQASPPDSKAPAHRPAQKPRAEPSLSVEAALARATAFYEAGQYAQCADAFAALLEDVGQSSALAPRAREQSNVYRAACLIALGRTEDSDEAFREAIRENPQMEVPNAIVFPPAVIERFIVVRTTLMEEIRRSEEERAYRAREAAIAAHRKAEREKIRVQQLEKLASQETLIVQNQRWLAWVPFGVGQFQNRDYGLGAAFLASEVLLLGTSIGATSIELSLNAQAKGGAGLEGDVQQLNQNIRTANDVALVTAGGFVLVAGLGMLQANLAFVPEFRQGVRERTKPKRAPTGDVSFGAAPLPGGGAFSLFGRF